MTILNAIRNVFESIILAIAQTKTNTQVKSFDRYH